MFKSISTYVRNAALALAAALAIITSGLSGPAAPTALVLGAAVATLATPTDAEAALSYSQAVRTARAQAVITAAGASAKLKIYNGTRPSGTAAVSGGNTLCASGTFGSTIGTATSGTIDFDEAGFTQSSAGFTACTPTFVDVTTSGDVVVMRIDIGSGAGNWQFTGTVVTGQNITLTTLVITTGNS